MYGDYPKELLVQIEKEKDKLEKTKYLKSFNLGISLKNPSFK